MSTSHPFTLLRRSIRQAGKQFRRPNDNSQSIFHPDSGFVYAYDISMVEDALDEYEKTLPNDYQKEHAALSMEEQIIQAGQAICDHHPSMDARDFARTVLAYLAIEKAREEGREPVVTYLDKNGDEGGD